jgi:3-oxoacyl-[acyl-carrier-protein] synthase II
MAKFSQYAIAAARQALSDAEWKPESAEEKERTVRNVTLLCLYMHS